MKSRADGKNPKRVIVILDGILPTEMSSTNIADAIKTLTSSFSVTIITRDPVQCGRIFPRAKLIPLLSVPIRGAAFAFYIQCWFVLPFLRADLVYVAGVEHVPSVAMSIGKPILCYGNCHPIQFVLNTRRKRGRLSPLLSRISSLGMSTGLRRCDLVLATSPQLAEVYKSLGIPSSKIREVTLGVQLDMFKPEGKRAPATGRRVLEGVYPGTISKERGLEVVVEGAKILAVQRRDFKIKLVGCSPDEEKIVRKLVKDAGVEDLFTILPPVPHADIPAILWSADFGISLLEPNVYFAASPPMKVLEFLAAGLPVIANKMPTHSLYLEDGMNALLVPYDADSFANAMRTIIEDPKLRERLSEGALMSSLRFSNESGHRALVESALELIQ
jgi:glycosyltransferase involved in cell wall biosynthesis